MDSTGSDSYNQSLSERRASSAASHLVQQGIPRNRITAEGRGETEPVASNDDEIGQRLNRRVEIAIFASEEVPTGAGGTVRNELNTALLS